jgi:23S rRNA pseudouridine1911/1915/1917 synthase
MDLKIIYEDDRLIVVDKPAGITIWRDPSPPTGGSGQEDTVASLLMGQFPELEKLGEKLRYGIVHRLDKDTSGILLTAKTKEAFEQFQKKFAAREVEKRYICLVEGILKEESGIIHTLLGRSPADRRKQRAYPLEDADAGKREAITEWKVLKRFEQYTLLEVTPKTGRKHQIRAHMASLGHPVAGDKLYGFKNQRVPQGLVRHFLHASFLKIEGKEFVSPLPEDLQNVLEKLSQLK